jgi:hypothetical protein
MKIKTPPSKQGKKPSHENVNCEKKGPKEVPPHGSTSQSPLTHKGGMDGAHGSGGGNR